MRVTEKIYELMKDKNVKNIKELSRECGIPYTTLRAIIDGTISDIKINTALKLCNFFNITLNELFSDELELSDIQIASHNGLEDVGALDVSDIEEINNFIKFVKSKKENK